ncbi:hypothetical protein ACQ4PT_055649 [Festuca glaucescens]
MTINRELQAGGGGGGGGGSSDAASRSDGGGGGTTAASRQATHVDLDPDVDAGAAGQTESEIPTGESLRQLGLRKAVERLERMCIVLGVDFKKKLMEMAVIREEDIGESRVLSQIDFLQGTIEGNYEKLKAVGKELLIEWELSQTTFKRMIQFAHVITISDSMLSSDVTDASFLSTTLLKKAQSELDGLRKERKKEAKKEYEKQRSRLKEIVFANHLTWESVGYDLKKKVNCENYNEETVDIGKSIERAKHLSYGRKELVFRVELVRQLIEEKKLPSHIIEGFLDRAKKHLAEATIDVPVTYDGENAKDLLDRFQEALDVLEKQQKQQQEKTFRMQRIRTRHGRSPSPDAPPQDSSDDEADA